MYRDGDLAMSLIRNGYPVSTRRGFLGVLFSALLTLALFDPGAATAQELKRCRPLIEMTRRIWIIANRMQFDVTVASSSPTWHTVLDIIGDLLTNRCQVEKLLFYRQVLSRFGKLPKLYRFVPKIISPIH